MNPIEEHFRYLTRRQFFHGVGLGVGSLALSSLLADETNASQARVQVHPPLPGLPHLRHVRNG